MGKSSLFTTLIISLFYLLVGCASTPVLPVYGDIPIGTHISSLDNLQALVKEYNIRYIFFVTSDSFAVEMRASSLSEIRLLYEDGQWNIHTENLPRTANLKDIKYLAVESDYLEYKLAIFNGNDKQEHISAYQSLKKEFELVGTSSINEHQISSYKNNPLLQGMPCKNYHDWISSCKNKPLLQGMPCKNYHIWNSQQTNSSQTILTIFRDGQEIFFTPEDLQKLLTFEYTHWTINSEILTIIWKDYPQNSLYDIYPKLNKSEPILIILLDGLGYNTLENAKARNRAGYFANIDFKPLQVMYPPRTLQALHIVGRGFHLNKNKDNIVKLFSDLKTEKGIIIQNDRSYFESKFPVILNTDRNNDGFIDDDVFETALEYIAADYDFIFVHFKSIDEISHLSGPYSENTLRQIEKISGFVRILTEIWEGSFLIFSDHGQHNSGFQGNHGTNRIEDMVGVIIVNS